MAKSMPTTITEFTRTPGTVFVNVSTPKPVQQVQQARRYYRDWHEVSNLIALASEPTSQPNTEVSEPCQTNTDEIRIYSVDSLTGKRRMLFTGQRTDDTDALCQTYANLAECRVEWHDAIDASVFHPDTCPIPTLSDWVEVVNSSTNEIIWIGLREKGFDDRCQRYADANGVGIRVDSADKPLSRFYTPRNETLQYARENARKFSEKYGVPVADAIGVVAITAVAWLSYVVMGVA